MLVYLLSIAFFVFVLLNGGGEEGLKSKLLTIAAVCVAGYNLYRIFLGTISGSFIINLLLCIIPGIVFFFGLLLVFDSTNANGENNNYRNFPNNEASFYKENIKDNEATQLKYQSSHTNNTDNDDLDKDAPINYKNSKIDGFGSCDVEETKDYIKITMKADGREYEFYVKGPNIVAYRFEKKGDPQSY